ncbi:MAG: ATP-binding protein [Candidatus Binatia bacterium]
MINKVEENSHSTILVVDDSPTVRLQLQKSLEYAGFTVASVGSGAASLEQFSTLHPALILLDVMMPDMDGFETCLALRKLPGGERTPIILLTSLEDIHSINRAYEVGATDFMTKPINQIILTHRLRYILRANKAFQELYQSKESLRSAQVELELRVKERTLELQGATELLQQEVQERQRTEDELRITHARLWTLIDNSPLAVVEWDKQFRAQRWSMQAESMFGWRAEEVIGKHPHDWCFIADEEVQTVEAVFDQLQKGPNSRSVTRNRNYKKDRTIIDVEWYNSVLRDESGSVLSVLSLAQDITERKQAERLKDELVSTVSHELRTPLTSLRGFTELMLRRNYPAHKQREFLAIIHNESVRLTNLLNDFLDIQRMESGRQNYRFEPVALTSAVQETVALFSLSDQKHKFLVDIPVSLPPIHADHSRLRQVFTNLLSNAIKFSPHGGAITIAAKQQGASVTVSVADQGVGIPPEALSQLFSKFFRVDNQETRSIGGTGLGLALIKKIIEAHDGRVWVESEAGKGSTFFFTLPTLEQPYMSQKQESALL